MLEVKAEEVPIEKGKSQDIKAMWFCCNYNLKSERVYITDEDLRKSILDRLKHDGINMLFLTMDSDNLDVYKDFLKDAHKRGIKVQALFDNPSMIYDDCCQWTGNVIDKISNYNNENEEVYKIDGIHYNIEFYWNENRVNYEENWIDSESEEARKSLLRKKYINFVRKACSCAYNKNIETAFDVPVWLDRFTFYDNDGLNKNIADEVCRAADYIVIMDCKNNAKNIFDSINNTSFYNFSDGSRTKSDMNWMERTAKFNNKLIIGVGLESFKNEVQAKDYITKIINDSRGMIEDSLDEEDLCLNYGYAIQSVYHGMEYDKRLDK